MKHLSIFSLLVILSWISACTPPKPLDPVAENRLQSEAQLAKAADIEKEAYQRLEAQEARNLTHPNYEDGTRSIVYLDAGSVDGLQAAISQAGSFGTVIVRTGLHIENQMITITNPVKIIGQTGAIIQSNVAPVLGQDPDDPATLPHLINPAILVDGASFVVIRKLKFVPDPSIGFGEMAVALQEADHAVVRANEFEGFGGAVNVNKSDFVVVRNNKGNGTLSEGAPIASNTGIRVASGASAIIAKNEMADFENGYFFSDKHGVAVENTAMANVFGFIWCTFPGNTTYLPTGDFIAADFPANMWSGVRNLAEDPFAIGIMIIDGANQNTLVSNNVTNSSGSDILFFGVLGTFPTSADNLFIAGAYPNVSVLDCGLNNTIIGGILDPNPCP